APGSLSMVAATAEAGRRTGRTSADVSGIPSASARLLTSTVAVASVWAGAGCWPPLPAATSSPPAPSARTAARAQGRPPRPPPPPICVATAARLHSSV
ncbi:MAG: hypothetical protein LC729_00180, partial [Acidobacteria bacterium]|nr:hypothetical protein [Acidobacteriota bacterium]